MVVAHPGTARAPIVNVFDELAIIKRHFRRNTPTVFETSSATVTNVIQGMERHAWVHLACHGLQSFKDPSESALFLESSPGSTSPDSRRLKLSQIIQKQFPKASFAFLSACQTAAGDNELPDEVVHLAAGMMMAGYSSVVATMWSIKDRAAPAIADVVYSDLLKNKHRDRAHAHSAYALQHAVQKFRRKNDGQFMCWVPFIHIGE
jgi:CHAT domain-containing protein